jgi:site-specific DNA recombinase
VSVLARAPYGYRYVKKSEHADALYEIDESEAPVVREMFRRYAEDGESIGRIARWLADQGVVTRTGKTGWNTATIWGILRNPAYAGQAAYGKTHATGQPVRETRHARQRGQRSARVSRENVSPEEWKPIAVPALVTAEQFALVQQQLERNSRFSPRNTRRPVAAARDPHLPRVRLRVLPLLDAQQDREAARVLPLLGHRRAPSPRRPCLR